MIMTYKSDYNLFLDTNDEIFEISRLSRSKYLKYESSVIKGACFANMSHQKSSATPSDQAPVPGSRHSSCALITHVCMRACAYKCTCVNVYERKKYQQI